MGKNIQIFEEKKFDFWRKNVEFFLPIELFGQSWVPSKNVSHLASYIANIQTNIEMSAELYYIARINYGQMGAKKHKSFATLNSIII